MEKCISSDQMLYSVASDLGPLCLPCPPFGNTRLQWIFLNLMLANLFKVNGLI